MKIFLKISLAFLLIALNYKPVAAFSIQPESIVDHYTLTDKSECDQESANTLRKNFNILKEYSSNRYIVESLFDEEDKKKVNKKQFSTKYKKEYPVLKNDKLALAQGLNSCFFVNHTPLYKLFQSWKIPCFKN